MEIGVCKTYCVTLGNFNFTSGYTIVCQLAEFAYKWPLNKNVMYYNAWMPQQRLIKTFNLPSLKPKSLKTELTIAIMQLWNL